jgi:hypothetical protein
MHAYNTCTGIRLKCKNVGGIVYVGCLYSLCDGVCLCVSVRVCVCVCGICDCAAVAVAVVCVLTLALLETCKQV